MCISSDAVESVLCSVLEVMYLSIYPNVYNI